jgi:hypothetical protein
MGAKLSLSYCRNRNRKLKKSIWTSGKGSNNNKRTERNCTGNSVIYIFNNYYQDDEIAGHAVYMRHARKEYYNISVGKLKAKRSVV